MFRRVAFAALLLVICLSIVQIQGQPRYTVEKASLQGDSSVEESKVTAHTVANYWESLGENEGEPFETTLSRCDLERLKMPQQKKITAQDPAISTLSWELTRDKDSNSEKVFSLFDFVSKNVSYFLYPDWRNASQVLSSRKGDCTDKSILLVSLLKNAGFDSYVVFSRIGNFSHAWTAVNLEGRWLLIDSSQDEFERVHECLEENCEYSKYYSHVTGLFNEDTFLRCDSPA